MQADKLAARVNCMNCEHYYVTWDARFPRGCRAYEFKSRHMPSAVVLSSTGSSCMHYERKTVRGS